MFDCSVRPHFYDVETDIFFFPLLQKIKFRHLDIPTAFLASDRFGRSAIAVARTGFDFHKHGVVFVLRQNIRFAEGGTVVGFQYFQALLFQIRNGELFPFFS